MTRVRGKVKSNVQHEAGEVRKVQPWKVGMRSHGERFKKEGGGKQY